ncbi:MAG TPA: rhodanese-like domain-containing protein [Chloroflexota bacterium]|nr:rhodanese-like domain-containing protein [Chloroflexota bacterium]
MHGKLDSAGAERIGLEQAKVEFDRGASIFVDVRGKNSYELSHIPGAISIPSKELMRHEREIPTGRPVTFY